jgi:hypothetical protein
MPPAPPMMNTCMIVLSPLVGFISTLPPTIGPWQGLSDPLEGAHPTLPVTANVLFHEGASLRPQARPQ